MKYGMLLILSGLFSCVTTTHNSEFDRNASSFSSITLVDTLTSKLTQHSSDILTTSKFHSVYTGPLKDTIEINYSYVDSNSQTEFWQRFKKPNSDNLIIYVDTAQLIGSALGIWGNILPPPDPSSADSDMLSMHSQIHTKWKKRMADRKAKKSYPIFIKNLSLDTLLVSFGYDLPLVLEAQDSVLNWKPIQSKQIYHCGTGLYDHFLSPNNLIISTSPIFDGTFETKMRIAYQYNSDTLYSNEFLGFINYSQFDELDLFY